MARKSPEQDILRMCVWHFPSSHSTFELDDEELLLELPLLRLGTEGAAAIEVGGDIVRSTVGAPGKLPKASNARASSNSANTAIKRLNPTLQRGSPNIPKTFCILRVGVGV